VLTLSTAQLDAWLALFIYPLARVSGIVVVAPLYSHQSIPQRVKVLLALALTISVAPMAGSMPDIPPASGTGIAILAGQFLIGLTIGFVMRIVFAAIDMAGELTGLQMGLGFATFFDPTNSTNTPVVAQLYGLFAMLFFLAFNGHLIVIGLLVKSFEMMPIASFAAGSFDAIAIARYGQQVFIIGLLFALPIVAALLAANLALGVLTRAAPQLNLFAVGFPATIFGGIVLLMLLLPGLLPLFEGIFMQSANFALDWVSSGGP